MHSVRLLGLTLLCLVAVPTATAMDAPPQQQQKKKVPLVIPKLGNPSAMAKGKAEIRAADTDLVRAGVAARATTLAPALYDDKEIEEPHAGTEISCKGHTYVAGEHIFKGGGGSVYKLKQKDAGKRHNLVLKVCNMNKDDVLPHEGVRACVYEAEMMVRLLTLPAQQSQLPVCAGRNFIILHRLKPFKLARRSHANTKQFRRVFQELVQFHDAGFAHNDIKAPNLMVDDNGKAVIIDFGVVSPAMQHTHFSEVGSELTGQGQVSSLVRDSWALLNIMQAAVNAQDAKKQHKANVGGADAVAVNGKVPPSENVQKTNAALEGVGKKVLRLQGRIGGRPPISAAELKSEVTKLMEEAFTIFWHRRTGGVAAGKKEQQQEQDKDGKEQEKNVDKEQQQQQRGQKQRKNKQQDKKQQVSPSSGGPSSSSAPLPSNAPPGGVAQSPSSTSTGLGQQQQRQAPHKGDDYDDSAAENDGEDDENDEADDENDDDDEEEDA